MLKKCVSLVLSLIIALGVFLFVPVSAVNNGVLNAKLYDLHKKYTAMKTDENIDSREKLSNTAEKSFSVNAKSNISQTVSKTYVETDKQFTVTYYLKADKLIADAQFYIYYNSDVLSISKAVHLDENGYETNFTPVFDRVGNTGSNLMEVPGSGIFTASSSLNPYNFSAENLKDSVFLTITFDIIGNYDENVDVTLDVYALTGVNVSAEGKYEFTEYIYKSVVKDVFKKDCETLTELSEGISNPTEKPTEESTVQPTTEPTTAETTVTEPTTAETTVTEPTTAETTVTEPTTAETTVTEPTTETTVTESTTAETTVTEATETQATETEATETEATETEATETTEPPTTESPTTEPTTTEPPVTNPTDPPKTLGDADGDGKVNVKDVTYIQLYLAKLLDEKEIDLSVCDVNGDGHINIRDVTYIQLRLANLL